MTEIQRYIPENPKITQLKANIEACRTDLLSVHQARYYQGIHITATSRYSEIPFGVTILPITHEWAHADYTPFDSQTTEAALREFAVTKSPKLQRAYKKMLITLHKLDQDFLDDKIDKNHVDERSDIAWQLFETKRTTYIQKNKIPLLEALQKAMQEAMNWLQQSPHCY